LDHRSVVVISFRRLEERNLNAPKAANGSIPSDPRGVGIAVNKPTIKPFANADAASSLYRRRWISIAANPRTNPTGSETPANSRRRYFLAKEHPADREHSQRRQRMQAERLSERLDFFHSNLMEGQHN